MFEAEHWRNTDRTGISAFVEELVVEADAIGIGSGAPTARLLRRAASELRLRILVGELPAAAAAVDYGRELDDLEAGRMMLELAEADQDEIEQLETEIAGLKAEVQQWHGELRLARERIRTLNAALAEAHGQILAMRTGPCDCPLCPDPTHGGENG